MADIVDQMTEVDARGAQIIQFLALRQEQYDRAGYYPGSGSILDYNRNITSLLRALGQEAKESSTPRNEVSAENGYFFTNFEEASAEALERLIQKPPSGARQYRTRNMPLGWDRDNVTYTFVGFVTSDEKYFCAKVTRESQQ